MQSQSKLSRLAAALGGLPVMGCLEGSPAAEAGVRYGDILLALDGAPTPTWDDFIRVRSAVRDRFVARIFRDGAELDIAIELRRTSKSPFELLSEIVDRELYTTASDEDADAATAADAVVGNGEHEPS